MEAKQNPQSPHIVMLPPPALLGHLIPFIEFAKRLVFQYNFSDTFVIPNDGSPINSQKALLEPLPVNSFFLSPVSIDDLPKDSGIEIRMPNIIIRSLPAIHEKLNELNKSNRISALVVDLFCPLAIDVAREFSIPAYIFFIISATDLSLGFNLPEPESSLSEYGNVQEMVQLAGSLTLHGSDIPDSIRDNSNDAYKWTIDLCNRYRLADGIIVNSFLELETDAFKDLQQHGSSIPPIYPVGPLIQSSSDSETDPGSKCIEWLNQQPPRSVLYISFGSGATLSKEQFNELALGLEMSGHRFLWVVRSPQENTVAAYFSAQRAKSPFDYLPMGFLERTKDKGLVVDSWVPQVQILSHGSTGGFVTQCGWNAILESVVNGVPVIAWPLCFEHKMNAVILTDGLKAAIRVKENENGLVEKGHISNLVNELIEGEQGKQVQHRMRDLMNVAANALSLDGSSTKSFVEVVQKWTGTTQC
ncbi:hydroquinone glucosyltransferase-like [Olea europaea subsp. europaea]|uniref:Glycosyltransferase n=1 Tax=Olea europaea subsp. europaea TaxID=158383 RepID=A0A8S0Q173_OLEEU|nr:hydroquinone glucosyltransferase-like [Olea europaea subsp. europaea]